MAAEIFLFPSMAIELRIKCPVRNSHLLPNPKEEFYFHPVSSCFFTSGMAMAWTSPAFAKIKDGEVDFTLEIYEMSLIAAIPFAGRFFSPLPMSYVMDLIGRKACLIVGRLLQIVHWIMIYFFHNVWVLYSARLINGWYSGIALFTLPVFIGETTHKHNRGRAQGVMNVHFLLGIVFESVIGATLSYDNLVLASGGLDLFLLLFILLIPETPYYYIMRERMNEAEISLQWLRGRDEDVSKELRKIERNMKIQLMLKSKYMDLFRVKSYRKSFLMVAGLMMIQRTSGMTAIIPYGSFIIPDTSWMSSSKGPILLNSTYLIMCAFSGFFVDSWGRKKFLILSSSGTTVFMVGCSIWFYLKYNDYDVAGTEWIVIIFLVAQAGFYSMGYFYIPTLVMSELFPMNIKAKANALGATLAVAISTVVVYVFLPLSYAYGLYTNFVIFSVSNMLGVIFSAAVMIETKGKSLEGIQAMLEGKKYSSETTISLPSETELEYE